MSSGTGFDFGALLLYLLRLNGYLVLCDVATTCVRVSAMDAAISRADAGTNASAASQRLLEACEAIPRKTDIA
jgi:hypothetical protein